MKYEVHCTADATVYETWIVEGPEGATEEDLDEIVSGYHDCPYEIELLSESVDNEHDRVIAKFLPYEEGT